jgi:hypothetical protein
MSEQVENVFDLLDDEDREEREEKEEEEAAGSAQDTTKDNKTNNLSIETESAVQMEESSADSSWTDVSSTKTRKVAIPVGSLFKQDTATPARGSSTTTTVPAPASSSSSAAAAAASQSSSDSQKKKGLSRSHLCWLHSLLAVVRFTREELLALYRPTKCLPEMVDLAEITALEYLEPECRNQVDTEEVCPLFASSPHSRIRL